MQVSDGSHGQSAQRRSVAETCSNILMLSLIKCNSLLKLDVLYCVEEFSEENSKWCDSFIWGSNEKKYYKKYNYCMRI